MLRLQRSIFQSEIFGLVVEYKSPLNLPQILELIPKFEIHSASVMCQWHQIALVAIKSVTKEVLTYAIDKQKWAR